MTLKSHSLLNAHRIQPHPGFGTLASPTSNHSLLMGVVPSVTDKASSLGAYSLNQFLTKSSIKTSAGVKANPLTTLKRSPS